MPAKPKAVLDTTVLISAFLTPHGVAAQLLARAGADFTLALAPEILTETARKLLTKKKIRKSYIYTDDDVHDYLGYVVELTGVMSHMLEPLTGVVRDPEDDMIVACAVTVGADCIVARDKDLLDLGAYAGISVVSPRQLLDSLAAA